MKSSNAYLLGAVFPYGAPPDQPAISEGGAGFIPQSLIDYFVATGSFRVVSAITSRLDQDNYTFQALVAVPGLPLAQTVFGSCTAGVVTPIYGLGDGALTLFTTGALNLQGGIDLAETAPFTIEANGTPISQPRGLIARTASAINTGAIGAETIIATLSNVWMNSAYAYKLKWRSQLTWTAAANVIVRVRLTNIAGTQIMASFKTTSAAGQDPASDSNMVAPVASGLYTLQLTLNASAGTVVAGGGNTNDQRYFEVTNKGAVAAYAGIQTF